MSPAFPENIPPRRHSIQASAKPDIAAALELPVTASLREVPETPTSPENHTHQASLDNKLSTKLGSQDGMRVLLVEDNEINLKLLVAYMKKLKLQHATACNGLEAVNAYKDAHGEQRCFDVIFMGSSLSSLSLLLPAS